MASSYLAIDGYQNGGLKGALINVATYWATQGIGKHFGHNPSSFNLANEAQRAVAHGLVGGTASALQGGSFKAGFFAGAVGSFGGSLLGMTSWGRSLPGNGFVRNVIGTAAFAGLGSTLGGGSFSRGFETGLMIGLFNHYGDEVIETFQSFSLGVFEGATGFSAGDGSTGSEHGDIGRTVGLWTGRVAGLAGVGKAAFTLGRKFFTRGAIEAAESAAVRTNFQAYEVLSQQTISGASRGAHRAAANRALLNQLDNSPELSRMFNQQLGTDVAAHMRLGKGAPLNPPGAVWHHPIDNPNALQLLRQVEHTTPALQPVLHPQGIGGFGTFYGP